MGVPAEEPTYAAGRELEAVLIEEKSTEDELAAAADSRDEARITKALKSATKLKMPETAGVKKATKMLEQLHAEVEALENLKKAVKANKAPGLLAAIQKCTELGLEDRKELAAVSAARAEEDRAPHAPPLPSPRRRARPWASWASSPRRCCAWRRP